MKFWFLAIFSVWGINAVVTGLPKGLLNSILALPLIWGLRCLYRSRDHNRNVVAASFCPVHSDLPF